LGTQLIVERSTKVGVTATLKCDISDTPVEIERPRYFGQSERSSLGSNMQYSQRLALPDGDVQRVTTEFVEVDCER
jgi:hypothetical protein